MTRKKNSQDASDLASQGPAERVREECGCWGGGHSPQARGQVCHCPLGRAPRLERLRPCLLFHAVVAPGSPLPEDTGVPPRGWWHRRVPPRWEEGRRAVQACPAGMGDRHPRGTVSPRCPQPMLLPRVLPPQASPLLSARLRPPCSFTSATSLPPPCHRLVPATSQPGATTPRWPSPRHRDLRPADGARARPSEPLEAEIF